MYMRPFCLCSCEYVPPSEVARPDLITSQIISDCFPDQVDQLITSSTVCEGALFSSDDFLTNYPSISPFPFHSMCTE